MISQQVRKKTREYRNRFFDSSVWNDLAPREGDIVIASYAKAGTTWLQQIVAQLIFGGEPDIDVSAISPWVDSVYPDKATKLALLKAQSHRRFMKTHLPADALVTSPLARYLYIGRDGRDMALSLYDHQCAVSQDAQARLHANGGKSGKLRVVSPPGLPRDAYVAHWLEYDGAPFWPLWENVRSWWERREDANVLLLHYADLLDDLPGQIRLIAAFLGITVAQDRWDAIVAHCRFDYMRQHAARYVPQGTGLWREDGKAFFNQGRIGRWREVLPAELNTAYSRRAEAELGRDAAQWLAHGQTQTS
ncbi:sulfotransferase domain-containing protein [Xanthomonas campestris pv. campestris]|uniref:sulfotransferase domain-containing protein n=1 Tax=Xanthomonas campestris TaxID=339 RepID=UPI000593A00F|nr:sulfotransferase domain-containing protein [Xanthomonas campestris]MCC3256104.1 sulfotransferase domain-containing protein [Xanthomonas campestris pv. armoraciae]MDO0790206.1 sulfotransferase domain-containing protein [Xanthomonas campestris pv. campestris]MDO0838578.1 sulfotransferase domain-containing protein [Xanthomonas campestris pv. campestris]MEB1349840.1 sulfotransferase domain-containing protein [Xanthomonas campestris pv. campestris]WDJ97086.1 sulfotransferase domain-containing pr